MLIVADENIPFVAEAFAQLGDVRTFPGRDITPATIADADVLLVRSITTVDRQLLRGSRVRFVATATIGTDHVDTAYLDSAGIGFAAAPGCNANAVAEYVVAALLALERRGRLTLAGSTIGVVGVGNVGSRVAAYADVLGMTVLRNDPPLARRTGDPRLLPLDALMSCDVITVHVPLTESGPDPTKNLFDARRFALLKRGMLFINTARGGVADESALTAALKSGHLGGAVLDVWHHEPEIDIELLRCATLATPHIAGYSWDGKVNGTVQVYAAACRFFGVPATWAPPDTEAIVHRIGARDDLYDVVKQAYDIQTDDARMRGISQLPAGERCAGFDALRRAYPRRLEFRHHRVIVERERTDMIHRLQRLGFSVVGE